MNKYELAELFGDVDDKFIEGAKPEAQQAVHLTIKKRSPLKMAIAVSCAAAVLVGGIITVNALRSGNGGLSVLSSGSGTVSLINGSSDISDNASEPSASDVSQEKTGNWFNETQIYYEGEYYMIPEEARSMYHLMDDIRAPHVSVLAGIRKSSENTVDIVTVLRNDYYEPAGIRSYGPDSVAEVFFTPKADDPYKTKSNNDRMTDRPLSVILEPGEVCYQKNSFKVGLGEYVANIDYVFNNAYPEQNGFAGDPGTKFDVEITENGVQDPYDESVCGGDNYHESPELKGKLFSDVVQQFKDEGVKCTIVSRLDDTVPKDCIIKAFEPVDPTKEHYNDAVIFVSLGSRNVGSTVSEPNENTTSDNSEPGEESKTVSEWAAKLLVLPSKFAPEDFDFVNTGNGFRSPNTTIQADRGSEVYAVDDGEVLFAVYDDNWNNGYGNHVVIKHAENLYTIYSHMLSAEESGNIVSAGDKVKAGQCIGLAGMSGNMRVYGLCYSFCTELPRFFKEDQLEVPDFTNKPWSYVIQQLANEGFKTTTVSRTDNTIATNYVIETDPPAHSMVDKGSEIVVVVSMGQNYSVGGESEFKGKPWSEVVQQLENEGFKYTTTFRIDDTIPRDCVIGTIPAVPSTADKDTKIIIAVSLGSDYDKISDGEHSELDLSADLDGDGVPDALEAINPDKTDEEWEQWKKFEAVEKQLEQEQQGNG